MASQPQLSHYFSGTSNSEPAAAAASTDAGLSYSLDVEVVKVKTVKAAKAAKVKREQDDNDDAAPSRNDDESDSGSDAD